MQSKLNELTCHTQNKINKNLLIFICMLHANADNAFVYALSNHNNHHNDVRWFGFCKNVNIVICRSSITYAIGVYACL